MNEGIHLDLDTWIVPGQIRTANLCRGLGNRYTPAGTEVFSTFNIFIFALPKLVTVFVCGICSMSFTASLRELTSRRGKVICYFTALMSRVFLAHRVIIINVINSS